MQRRRRRHLARLDDAGAAGGERERKLLRHDQQRKVPRRDDRDDADRLAQDQAEPVGPELRVALAVQLARERRGVAPDVGRAFDFAARLGDRLAGSRAYRAAPGSRGRGRSDRRPSTARARAPRRSRRGQRPASNALRAAAMARSASSARAARHARDERAVRRTAALDRLAIAGVVAAVDPHRPVARKARQRLVRAWRCRRRSASGVHRNIPPIGRRNSAPAWRETPRRPRRDPRSWRSARRRAPSIGASRSSPSAALIIALTICTATGPRLAMSARERLGAREALARRGVTSSTRPSASASSAVNIASRQRHAAHDRRAEATHQPLRARPARRHAEPGSRAGRA